MKNTISKQRPEDPPFIGRDVIISGIKSWVHVRQQLNRTYCISTFPRFVRMSSPQARDPAASCLFLKTKFYILWAFRPIAVVTFMCVGYITPLTVHDLNVQMLFYCCPLQATVVYQENLNPARNRTRMIDFWLWPMFSSHQVNHNNNNKPLWIGAQYLLHQEGNPSLHYLRHGDTWR